MEMLRTLIVALVFAGITVCTYYYLNSSQFPWEIVNQGGNLAQTSKNPEDNTLPAPTLNDSESRTFAQDGPFTPASSKEDEFSLPDINELPPAPGVDSTVDNPMVVASTTPEQAPVLDTELPSLDETKTASPFDTTPESVPAQPQKQIGTYAEVEAETTSALPAPEDPDLDLPPAPALDTNPIPPTPASPDSTDPYVAPNTGGVSNPLRVHTQPTVPVQINPPAQTQIQAPAPVQAAPAPTIAETPAPIVSPSPETVPQTQIQAPPQEDAETAAIREYLKKAAEKIQNGEMLEVLQELSKFYGNPCLSAEESSVLVNYLVQTAAQVIYSQNSFLEPAYTVQQGDTMEKIAAEYQVPQAFISLVNGLQPGAPLQAGTQLKVIRGPFHAIIYLDRHEMILTLNGLFAGRFWIGIGGDLVQKDSDFLFLKKTGTENGDALPSCAFITRDNTETVKIQACTDPNAIGANVPSGAILMNLTDVQNLNAILGENSQLLLRCHSPKPTVQQTASVPAAVPAPTAVQAPAPVPAPASVPAPAPAYGASAELPDSLPSALPDTLPEAAPASAPAAEELPLELPATL